MTPFNTLFSRAIALSRGLFLRIYICKLTYLAIDVVFSNQTVIREPKTGLNYLEDGHEDTDSLTPQLHDPRKAAPNESVRRDRLEWLA